MSRASKIMASLVILFFGFLIWLVYQPDVYGNDQTFIARRTANITVKGEGRFLTTSAEEFTLLCGEQRADAKEQKIRPPEWGAKKYFTTEISVAEKCVLVTDGDAVEVNFRLLGEATATIKDSAHEGTVTGVMIVVAVLAILLIWAAFDY